MDPNFRLVRGVCPYVLRQLLTPDGDENTPEALRKLLVRLLNVNGEGKIHFSCRFHVSKHNIIFFIHVLIDQ